MHVQRQTIKVSDKLFGCFLQKICCTRQTVILYIVTVTKRWNCGFFSLCLTIDAVILVYLLYLPKVCVNKKNSSRAGWKLGSSKSPTVIGHLKTSQPFPGSLQTEDQGRQRDILPYFLCSLGVEDLLVVGGVVCVKILIITIF